MLHNPVVGAGLPTGQAALRAAMFSVLSIGYHLTVTHIYILGLGSEQLHLHNRSGSRNMADAINANP